MSENGESSARRRTIIVAMDIDSDIGYEAVKARDARFDGRLFVGVTSTGIYCRPICRVRTPRRENCRFFDSAAQAEAAAFRPCLKCRPEIAPGPGLAWTAMDASRTLARQAARALDAQRARAARRPASRRSPARLGVSDRHLRRIFAAEHGVTPMQYLQTRRLLLAKQLLTDTRLPMTQVALASGFRSLRRFNAAFVDGYRMSPSRLRGDVEPTRVPRVAGDEATRRAIEVTLGYRAALRRRGAARLLRAARDPGHRGGRGRRAIRRTRARRRGGAGRRLDRGSLRPDALARAASRSRPRSAPSSGGCIAAVRRWLDLDAAPETIDAALAELPGEPGLRLPGSVDAFELAVRAVLGQQVTVAGAHARWRAVWSSASASRSRRRGPTWTAPFPAPEALAAAPIERIGELGIIRSRAARHRGAGAGLADAGAARSRRGGDRSRWSTRCRRLPGIGAWTAHYIAMRALGWPDAFPPGDVAAAEGDAGACSHLGTQRRAETRAQAWRPWRCYARAAPVEFAVGDTRMSYATDRHPSPRCTRAGAHASPLGPLLLVRTDDGLAGAWFEGQKHHPDADRRARVATTTRCCSAQPRSSPPTSTARRDRFDVPLDLQRHAFQRAVWPSCWPSRRAHLQLRRHGAGLGNAEGGARGRRRGRAQPGLGDRALPPRRRQRRRAHRLCRRTRPQDARCWRWRRAR